MQANSSSSMLEKVDVMFSTCINDARRNPPNYDMIVNIAIEYKMNELDFLPKKPRHIFIWKVQRANIRTSLPRRLVGIAEEAYP